MEACTSHEIEPLYNEDLEVLGIERHVLNPAEPREIIGDGFVRAKQWRRTWIVSISVCCCLLLPAALLATWPGENERTLPYYLPYDFVGEGNCKPNRPQWAKEASYEQCRAICDEAASCIGFDWDSKEGCCRARFASNEAIVSPPLGFEALYGIEGGRFTRNRVEGIEGIEAKGSHTAGCYQKAQSIPFRRFLSAPMFDSHGNALVGPLPDIFEYYRETGLLSPLKDVSKHLTIQEIHGSRVLAYNGTEGAMILPSLDAVPLLRAVRKDILPKITVMVGVNSDSYNRGLGIIIEASPQINETAEHSSQYIYNGYGVQLNRNVIKFHPDMHGGQLRIEGPGGFADTDLGFTPPGWSRSGYKLNMLEVTTGDDGNNEVLMRSAIGNKTWRTTWRHKLFDGKDIPTVYAFMDLGGESGKPLMVGQVSLRVKT